MMISAKPYLPIFTLVLVVFTLFTVSLTETIQISDGAIEWKAAAYETIFEVNLGESQMQVWPITNLTEEPIGVEFYALGEGSELFIMPEHQTIPPMTRYEVEIFIQIPEDHKDNVEYHPELKVFKRPPDLSDEAIAAIKVIKQYTLPVVVKIGDNPVYTPVERPPVSEIPDKPIIAETQQENIVEEVEETIEEKIARLKAQNEATKGPEVKIDDTFEEEAVPELQVDDSYIEEPIAEINAVDNVGKEKIECDFFAMILSWFGIGKC